MKMHPERIEMVKKQYPVGTRIQLDSLCNDERGMPSGLCGTVVGVDDQPALLMKWDNGRSLSLMPFDDNFTVIPRNRSLRQTSSCTTSCAGSSRAIPENC